MKPKKTLAALFFAALLLSPVAVAYACNDITNSPQSSGNSSPFSSHLPETEESLTSDSEDSLSSFVPESSSSSSSSVSSSSSSSSISASESQSSEQSSSSAPTPSASFAQYIRCTGDNVNIRAGAGTNFSVLGSAKKGTMYAIIGKTNGWYKTYYRNQIAYISASYASVFTLEKCANSKTESVLNEGYKLIGTPYVYGAVRLHDGKGKLLSGFSAQKFDCSSLVQYVFYKGAKTLLQVNTRTQVKQGAYVKPSQLQRGDCIFFTNEERQYNTGIERIGHVAIYLGDDYILHTASDYARIEKMSAYRWNFYVEARRFL